MSTKTITIALNASLDLHLAGMDNSDEAIESFEEAFRVAAEYVGADHDVELEVTTAGDVSMDEEATSYWQECHNRLEQIGPTEWRFAG